MENKLIDKQKIFNLIELITPYNNQYRDFIKEGERGVKVLILMWNVGEILDKYIIKNKIRAHNLYWQIYGKAEGLKTSYITRDFLSYCLRIRSYFLSVSDIIEKFSQLQRYSLFREAFPLLENPKFKLTKVEQGELIVLLNSNIPSQKIKSLIVEIKSKRIGIKNTRKQKLNEMDPIVNNFTLIYEELFLLIRKNDKVDLNHFSSLFPKDLLISLSQSVSALTQENLFIPSLTFANTLPENWTKFIENLKYLLNAAVEVRNRFRRLVSPKQLFDLADMIIAFTLDRGVANYRKRKHII